jgi:hypothetical protein
MEVETEGGVMKRKSSLRLVRRLGLALAVAAFAAPAAAGAPQVLYADDLPRVSSEPVAAPQVLYADDLHSMLPRPVSSEPRTDGLVDSLGRPLEPPPTEMLVDSLGRPLGPADAVQPGSTVAAASTGFDWSYAGIGAVGAFGLMLLGIGVLLVGRHNRRSRLATA